MTDKAIDAIYVVWEDMLPYFHTQNGLVMVPVDIIEKIDYCDGYERKAMEKLKELVSVHKKGSACQNPECNHGEASMIPSKTWNKVMKQPVKGLKPLVVYASPKTAKVWMRVNGVRNLDAHIKTRLHKSIACDCAICGDY